MREAESSDLKLLPGYDSRGQAVLDEVEQSRGIAVVEKWDRARAFPTLEALDHPPPQTPSSDTTATSEINKQLLPCEASHCRP
jgi:hypothetical protein